MLDKLKNIFNKSKKIETKEEAKGSDIDDVAAGAEPTETVDLTNAMAAYTAAITKTKDIKLSKK